MKFTDLSNYRENNRLEAKKALGGLPESLWETYSAFANTLGGIILLGVEEHKDKTLHAVNLPDSDKLIAGFWNIINNKNKVSVNILTDKNVQKQTVDGKQIVAITVPKAERMNKPVYIGENPFGGTYRRNGDGDYKCTKEEVSAMIRDAAYKSQDMLVIEEMDLSVFNRESLRSYRQRMKLARPGHVWESLDDDEFLHKLGAVGKGSDNKRHPTAAGLLMFGNEYDIVREFNLYFLDYQERYDADNRYTDRIISSSGDWSGNVYDFYFRVYNKLVQDIKVPFKLVGAMRVEDTPVHHALREALANCLVNADYYGRQGVVVVKDRRGITLSNPGDFRIDMELAKSGGVSDPRNGTMLKMFNLIDIGERAGSGIPNIYHVWEEQGWAKPTFSETFEPERAILSLELDYNSLIIAGVNAEKGADNAGVNAGVNADSAVENAEVSVKNAGENAGVKLNDTQRRLLNLIKDDPSITQKELAQRLDKNETTISRAIRKLKDRGILCRIGSDKSGYWEIVVK